MSVAFLGPRGTFSEDAALTYLRIKGREDDLIAFASLPALTAAVETGLADLSLLPIENSIEGSINTTVDLLIHETPLKIQAEVVVPVRHFLITAPGAKLSDIAVVASKPEALGQCRRFLERCLPNAHEEAAFSTAGAVEEVCRSGDKTRAAVGTARSAELYGGAILAQDIQDNRANVTRFVALAREDAQPTGRDKTSIAFTIKANVPGALHAVLSIVADAGLQMTKIESRPTKAWLGDYVFLIDVEGHRLDAIVASTLAEIRRLCRTVQVFGSYPQFPIESLGAFFEAPGMTRALGES